MSEQMEGHTDQLAHLLAVDEAGTVAVVAVSAEMEVGGEQCTATE